MRLLVKCGVRYLLKEGMKVTDLKQLGQQAKEASYTLGLMDTRQKNTC
jgi:hypothetical protein